jgi:integrase
MEPTLETPKYPVLPAGLTRRSLGVYDARFRIKHKGQVIVDTERVIEVAGKNETKNAREASRQFIELKESLRKSAILEEWTFAEAIVPWLAEQKLNAYATWLTRRSHAASIEKAFGKYKLSEVSGSLAQQWVMSLPCEDVTAEYYRASFKSIYKFARRHGRFEGATPITEPRKTPVDATERLRLRREGRKARALIGPSLPKFFDAVQVMYPELYVMARVQHILGCRWSEAAALEWEHIDWESGVVHICQNLQRDGTLKLPKTGHGRYAPLGSEGLELLQGHREEMNRAALPGHDVVVFPRHIGVGQRMGRPIASEGFMWTYGQARRKWQNVFTKTGIKLHSLTHSLRHSNATIIEGLRSDEISAMSRLAMGHGLRVRGQYTDESVHISSAEAYGKRVEASLLRASGQGGGKEGGNVRKINFSRRKTQ